MTIEATIQQLKSLLDHSAAMARESDAPVWKADAEALSAAIQILTQQADGLREMALRDALEEVRHARKMVTCGREAALAAEISTKSRAEVRKALVLAEQALRAQIYSLTAESEDES